MREMKDSGIEWIGEIPVGWEVCRIKELFHEINERCENGNDYTLLSVSEYYGVLPKSQRISDDMLTHAETLDGYKVCHKNDIVMNIMLAWKRALGVSQYEGIVSPAYCVYRTNKELDSKYFHFLYRTDMYANLFKQFSTGIIDSRLRLYPDKFLSLKCQVPPLEEQHRISAYLDIKCEKIDSIIARQQDVIEKLKAYKLSIITEAVTNGLNPNVRMKDSGYEFIGAVPQHWNVCRLRNIGTPQNGISKGGEFFGHGYPFVSYGDVYRNFTLPENVNGLVDTTEEERMQYSVKSGDIFFTRTSETIEEVGFSCVCEKTIENATFAGFVIRVRPFTDDLLTSYAKYYFRSNHHRSYLVKEMNLVTRASLGQNLLKSMPVLLPPKSEQQQIADHLDKKCSAIDFAIAKKQAIIEKLTAYKKSLIYEVVTGKREVYATKKSVAVICPVGIPTNEEEYARMLLIQKIITRCGEKLKGRTHLMKMFYAIELGIGFSFNTEYIRYYHGPYDKKIVLCENALAQKGWIKLKKGKRVEYTVTDSTAYKSDYKRIFGKYNKEIERIIDFFKSMKRTSKAEKVATLLASWNDFLIDGIAEPTDDMIINDVMNNWTDNKKNISYEIWQEMLNQMRKAKIIAHGYGRHTTKKED